MCARLFAAGRAIARTPALRSDYWERRPLMLDFEAFARESGLVEPPLMTETDHFLDENGLLLVVEAGE